jgi:hypothetical protein
VTSASELSRYARRHVDASLLLRVLTAVAIVLSIIFGGGTVQGLPSDAVVQLASLPLLGLAVVMLFGQPLPSHARLPLALAAGIALLPVLQLVPLPPDVWTRLPGRSGVVESLQQTAIPLTWWPISLDPAATWRSFLSLLPPFAVFLAVLCMGFQARRKFILMIVGLAVVSFVVGLVQLMHGPTSPLRFYEITNQGSSVGFFANRNHYAALLYSVLPFAFAWTIATAYQRHRSKAFSLSIGAVTIVAVLLGIGMAQSRAGVVLGLAALLLGVLLLNDPSRSGSRRLAPLAIFAASLFGILLVVHYALPGLLNRFEATAIDDYRFEILAVGRSAAESFLPFGSGLGTFEAVYQMHDRPEALLSDLCQPCP